MELRETLDIERLAAGLTKAQRNALLRADRIPFTGYYLATCHPATRGKLRAHKLIAPYSVWRDRLTPLGLALRDHLEKPNAE